LGRFLGLRLTLTGEPEFTTSEEAEDKVDDLIDIHEYHHDGEDLSEFPFIADLDDAPMVYLVSPHLDHGLMKG
jgi:hypothetical protein